MSPPESPPLALLFDIGGVCVVSPFQAILDYERAHNIPVGWINVAISASKPDGAWHRLERGEMKLDAEFFTAFSNDLGNQSLWDEYVARSKADAQARVPRIDVEWLLDAILRISRQPDPHMFPALKKLKASNRFLMAALSNTMLIPDGHFANQPHEDGDVKSVFDPFVSSAHSGVRKPEMRAYELAMQMMQAKWRQEGKQGQLNPENVLFLDDIGENLRQGRKMGFRTLKVKLGDTRSAVRELERITGTSLLEDGAKL